MAKIKTSEERLKAIVKETVYEALAIKNDLIVHIPDKCDFNGAFTYITQELGFPVRKSTLYKLTASNDIPCQRLGNRLVFSRDTLKNWFESRIQAGPKYNAALELSRSAQRKLRRD
jgi:hypothetical protein